MIDMLVRYGIKGETDIAQVPYFPQKLDCFSARTQSPKSPLVSAERTGISSMRLVEMIGQIEAHKDANLHTLLVLRHGKVICRAAAKGYDTGIWSLTHSMAKSITALAVGQLIDAGQLTLGTKLVDILADDCPGKIHPHLKNITIWHLLSMSAGISGISEPTSVVCAQWSKAFFESVPDFEPGTRFHYNSMNTYMLSCIIQKITKKSLSQWLSEHLFRPMGIQHFFCEKGPEGKEKGGWGMYVAPEDMAKLGQLFLQGGKWEGRQIVSEKWLGLMCRKTFSSEDKSNFDYGLHIWVSKEGDSFLFSGMLGQNVWICPKTDTVVVLTAGNNFIFERSNVLEIIANTLANPSNFSNTPLKTNKKHDKALRLAEKNFWIKNAWLSPLPTPGFWGKLWAKLRKTSSLPLTKTLDLFVGNYAFPKNNIGILPLFVRFMQNNHTEGLSFLHIQTQGERLQIGFEEGEKSHWLEVGLYDYTEGALCFGGEQYQVKCAGQLTSTEDGLPVLKIEVIFPEIPNIRRMKLYPERDTLRVAMTELPGKSMIDGLVEQFVPQAFRGGGIAGFIRDRMFGADPFKAIGVCVEPVLCAKKVDIAYPPILDVSSLSPSPLLPENHADEPTDYPPHS